MTLLLFCLFYLVIRKNVVSLQTETKRNTKIMKQTKFWTLTIMMIALYVAACDNSPKEQNKEADKLIQTTYKAKDYPRLMLLADSLENSGNISQAKAYYWRGYASEKMKQLRMAEFYWKTALEAAESSSSDENMEYYAKTASRLANMLSVRGDYEGTLKIAIPVAERLEKLECDSTSDYLNLLIYIGCCQSGVNPDASIDGFERAYQRHLENIEKNRSDISYKNAIAGLINIAYCCIYTKNYKDAVKWINHFGELLSEYEQRLDASAEYIDKQLARFDIYKAIALQGLGEGEEAAEVYKAFLTTNFSHTPEGHINANDYLIAANRWDEAADNYSSLDALMKEQKSAYSLDDIRDLILKKYKVNLLAGRRDTAIAVSMNICDLLETAFAKAKKLDIEEQATIVNNIEKISEHEAEVDRQKQYAWIAAMGFVFLGFAIFTLYRRRRVRRIEDAYSDLQYEFDELETRTAKQEREETEHRIASEIQDTVILPEALPRHQNLGIYTARIAGQISGGSLCDFKLRDNRLYFCIGDVLGKDVRASLMTALVSAQFKTISDYETEPDKIISIINQVIATGNDNQKPVRCFVGILDMTTGKLCYCNAGHEAPVMTGAELGRLPIENNQPIGAKPDGGYIAQEIVLAPGTMLFFYTHALLDAMNKEHRHFGEKRMLGTALQAMKLDPTPKPFLDNMSNAIFQFIGNQPLKEDLAMLTIQYTGKA